ncbi:MAG TPA: transcription termination/antitermination protein NusA [Thermoflexia bacterium]|jgi:N utilization substance protein A|nr:transcription termination/antitermination protein NusA [Thermoflexia bacterium]
MKSEFILALNQICADRNLSQEVVLEAIKSALVRAYQRDTGAPAGQNVQVKIDLRTGGVRIYAERLVVAEVTDPKTEISLEDARKIKPDAEVGERIMVEDTPANFGRIAAQTARQVILQRIREAEREAQYNHFREQEGELVYGTVQSVSPHQVTLRLGRTEAIMPRKEQVPGERYNLHDRIRAYVLEVRKTPRGPEIIVSRSHKKMLRRLLELEVPEIANGTVEIKAIAREAGSRSKVAVAARQPGVDPVGACVGMRGIRIQSIVKELGGEKVDIIEWSPDPVTFIAKALSPAKVLSVMLEEDPVEGRTANVVVPDDQLSLAIGRAGQNARLAAKLTGWRIDIQSVTEAVEWAIQKINEDPELLNSLGPTAERLPTVVAALRHHKEEGLPYNLEEMAAMREVIEAVRRHYISMRDAERARLAAQEAARRAALEEARAAREAEIQAAKARIPPAAYDIPITEIGLSQRVLGHLQRGGIENVGQLMEHLAEGDEGLLKLDGIGPKALSEVHNALDQLDLPPAEPKEEVTPAEAAPVTEAPVAEEKEPVAEAAPLAEPPAPPAEEVPTEAIAPPVEEAPAEAPPSTPEEAVEEKPEEEEEALEEIWEEVLEEEEEEEEEVIEILQQKKKRPKRPKRQLVYDEELGRVVAIRRHRRGELDEDWLLEEDWEDLA